MEDTQFRDIVMKGINFQGLEQALIRAGWKKPGEEQRRTTNKNKQKLTETFTDTVKEYSIEKNYYGYQLKIITENSPALCINLNYPNGWGPFEGDICPNVGTKPYKFFVSCINMGINTDIKVEEQVIKFSPDIIGKQVTFNAEKKEFTSKTNNGKPTEYIEWTITKIERD